MVTLQEDSQYFLCYDKETDPGAKVPHPTIAPQYSGKLPMNPSCMTGIGMTGIGVAGFGVAGISVSGFGVAGLWRGRAFNRSTNRRRRCLLPFSTRS